MTTTDDNTRERRGAVVNPLLPVLILGAAGGLFLALLYVVTMILVVFRD